MRKETQTTTLAKEEVQLYAASQQKTELEFIKEVINNGLSWVYYTWTLDKDSILIEEVKADEQYIDYKITYSYTTPELKWMAISEEEGIVYNSSKELILNSGGTEIIIAKSIPISLEELKQLNKWYRLNNIDAINYNRKEEYCLHILLNGKINCYEVTPDIEHLHILASEWYMFLNWKNKNK